MPPRIGSTAKRQRTLQSFFSSVSPANDRNIAAQSNVPSEDHQFFIVNSIQLRIFEHCNFLDIQQFATLLASTDPDVSFSASTFASHQCLQFSSSFMSSSTQPVTTYVLQQPLLKFTTNLNVNGAIKEFFKISMSNDNEPGNYNHQSLALQPLCIFAEAGPKGKGGKEPPHAQNKIAWDLLSKYSVTFLNTKDQRVLRVHVCQQNGICVQDIVRFRYNSNSNSLDSKIGDCSIANLKMPWRPFNEAQKLINNMDLTSELGFLLDSEGRIKEGLPRMFNCGTCRRPVGRSESAFHRHASDIHNLTITWQNFFACEHCLLIFFDLTSYNAHMDRH